MGSHERSAANRRLATIIQKRLAELEEKELKGTAIVEVGRKVYNIMASGNSHQVAPKVARKAITALSLEPEERNIAFTLLLLAKQAGGCHPFPRRREKNFRQREGIRR